MMSNNSEGADPTSDDPSNPILAVVPELIDEDDLTQLEPDEWVNTDSAVRLTKAFRMAGQCRTWIDFERVRLQLPEPPVKQWSMVFTSEVKAVLYSEFGPSLSNAVPRETWMATRTMSEFVQLIAPLKPPHAGEIGEHVTGALLQDLYSEVEDEAEIKVIGNEHNGMDIKIDVDLIELRDDDPFDGFAEHKLTRVSKFKALIVDHSPRAVSSDISHHVSETDTRRPTSNPRL